MEIESKMMLKLNEMKILMIVSLVIQVLLAFLAPLRKRKANRFLTSLLWLLYLSATPVSLSIIGLITRTIDIYYIASRSPHPRSNLYYMLWASFSLLHLGGPDSITSLSLEDNELWLRQALQLVTQVSLTLYVFGLYIYYDVKDEGRSDVLWLSIDILVFTNGCIKYFEKICALYHASRAGIRASHNREAPMTTSETEDKCLLVDEEIHVNEFEIVKHAYSLYVKFRFRLADDVLTVNDELGGMSQVLFLHQPVNVGLRITEVELNLIYDTFHTKLLLMSVKRAFLRISCFVLVIASSLLVFFSVVRKLIEFGFDYISVITLALFTGAVLLDIASFIGFLFSDWCIIMVVKLLEEKPSKVLESFLLLLQKWIRKRNSHAKTQRWCEMCSSYNLLDCSLNHNYLNKFLKVIGLKRIKDLLIDWLYIKKHRITRPCLEFIFKELQQKAKIPTGDKRAAIEQVCSARGNLVFEDGTNFFDDSMYLQPWTVNIHYNQSLLIWHLATDICYWADFCNNSVNGFAKVDHRSLSKQLSDYMAYILLRQSEMVPQLVGKSDEQFEDTKHDIIHAPAASSPSEGNLKEFCTNLFQQHSRASGSSFSVFQESCSLAQKLNVLDREKKWETICKVWVEMLGYAAIRSLPRYNFARLSKGGELITLVWLYMTQLGFLPFKVLD